MLFNSINFAFFLPVVFVFYWWANKNLKTQNLLLLVASYFFYASWDYRFLFLLLFSTSLDYFTALRIFEAKNKSSKKFWLWLSITINLGFLGVFKYYNFFALSLNEALMHLGINTDVHTLEVILPIGISFYTFHGLSYVIDTYRNIIKPTKNFLEYAVFVSFFPLLVAGPIERGTTLLPQIQKNRTFDYAKAVNGLIQILWGLFKKIAIADNLSVYVNRIFNHTSSYSGSTLIFGAFFFSWQLYCDFSGYSDIALGTARLLGIELSRNFAFPFFSRDFAEFWSRWNISVSTWFRDYLFIPLGTRVGAWLRVRNVFIVFVVIGLWHGANWTYIAWGLLNAIFFLPTVLLSRKKNHLFIRQQGMSAIVAQGRYLPSFNELLRMGITFTLATIGIILFRSENIGQAILYYKRMFSGLMHRSAYAEASTFISVQVKLSMLVLLASFILFEWFGREQQYALALIEKKWSKPGRLAVYYLIIVAICFWGGSQQQFIYFQF